MWLHEILIKYLHDAANTVYQAVVTIIIAFESAFMMARFILFIA